jgi:hypothetical protein
MRLKSRGGIAQRENHISTATKSLRSTNINPSFEACKGQSAQIVVVVMITKAGGIMNPFDQHILEIQTNQRICFIPRMKLTMIFKINKLAKWRESSNHTLSNFFAHI